MTAARVLGVFVRVLYAALPAATYVILSRTPAALPEVVVDVVLSTIPMLFLASITWRLVWPRWTLFAKVLLHPCIYAILSVYIGHWCILLAWIHQGVLGLGGHIWFSRKHGFRWYAVEDPERYVELSKQSVNALASAP